MSATIDAIREKLHHYIEAIEDKKVEAIYTLFEEEIINIEQYNKEIEDAEKEIDAGNYYTHEQILSEIRNWKKNAV